MVQWLHGYVKACKGNFTTEIIKEYSVKFM